MAQHFVMLGPPGAGKGTQAKILSEKMGIPHISSGDLFRENLREKTDLGKLAEGYINRGELVPDDVTIRMVQERISRSDCQAGVLLDGFPRTVYQAEALDEILRDQKNTQVDAVPCIIVADDVLVERLSGRRSCQNGHVFHVKFNPPKVDGICDVDGTELYQREDDTVETVSRRIRVYLDQTQPLIDYYRQKGVLVEIDGAQAIDAVSEALFAAIAKM
ncbi:MAG: adenylate kinase [Anaerolineae bacterium]|nr:adenylate kinase [Anaerolineae bacterium]MBL6965079.1 adenylate kinase [Anaerolineales bacterium]